MIKLHSYTLNSLLLTNKVMDAYINNFWGDVFAPLLKSGGAKHIMLLCKVEFNDSGAFRGGYRTLGELRRVNFEDKDLFIDYLVNRLGLLTESYVSNPISKITFSYIVKEGLATGDRRLLQDLSDKSVTTHRFNNLNLPISMNPSDYGNVLLDNYIQTSGVNLHRFIVENGKLSYIIDISSDELINKVRIQGPADLQWTDTKISDDVFKREIGKSIIFFMGGEIVLRKKVLSAKPFRKQSKDKDLESEFVTMDIETITQEGNLVPYLICAFNGKDYITSYANDPLVRAG